MVGGVESDMGKHASILERSRRPGPSLANCYRAAGALLEVCVWRRRIWRVERISVDYLILLADPHTVGTLGPTSNFLLRRGFVLQTPLPIRERLSCLVLPSSSRTFRFDKNLSPNHSIFGAKLPGFMTLLRIPCICTIACSCDKRVICPIHL
jgi:hypothetical protein